MTKAEFHTKCASGRCPRGNRITKQCNRESRQDQCYRRYCAVQERKAAKTAKPLHRATNPIKRKAPQRRIKKDEHWEAVRDIVFKRDNYQCRIWCILNTEEKQYILTHYKADFQMLQELDPAHELGRNASPENKYNVDMIYTVCRYFHSLLDTYKDPVYRTQMNREQRNVWFERIKAYIPENIYSLG